MTAGAASPIRTILEGRSPNEVRQAVAQFALANADKIRAIARRKLTLATRSVHDSEDVFSSVLRRLDTLAADGKLRPRSENDLWGLVVVIARNCAVSKTRMIERAKSILTDDGPLAYEIVTRLDACVCDEEATVLLRRMMAALSDSRDRQILDLQFRGANHAAIAAFFGISPEASRQRWGTVRRKLSAWFAEGGNDA